MLFNPEACRYGKRPHVIGQAALFGGNKIGKRQIGNSLLFLLLITKKMETVNSVFIIIKNLQTIANGYSREDSKHCFGFEPFIVNDVIQHSVGILQQLFSFAAFNRIF